MHGGSPVAGAATVFRLIGGARAVRPGRETQGRVSGPGFPSKSEMGRVTGR
jgi:hypothetical protein